MKPNPELDAGAKTFSSLSGPAAIGFAFVVGVFLHHLIPVFKSQRAPERRNKNLKAFD